jgi:sugar lactone lactonase YvrE
MWSRHRVTLAAAAGAAGALLAVGVAVAPAAGASTTSSFVGGLHKIATIASTVPKNGDVNPYGVAVVISSKDRLHRGDVLVSNFNDKANAQGTGTTIVEVAPNGAMRVFAQISAAHLPGACPGGIGLTTALSILGNDWVVVGSLPTTGGNPATAKAGCLLVLNSDGRVVETFHGHGINGPWDMTSAGNRWVSDLFVTNVLNGTVNGGGKVVRKGTVLRLTVTTPVTGLPRLIADTTIGSGFPEETNAAALVIGPTGVGLGRNGTLYVADTLGNRIAAVPDAVRRRDSAGTGFTVSRNGALRNPLGVAIAPNGDVLAVNSNNGNLVEITPGGRQVAVKKLDTSGSPAGAGALFGLAVAPYDAGVYFVDDATNTLDLLH